MRHSLSHASRIHPSVLVSRYPIHVRHGSPEWFADLADAVSPTLDRLDAADRGIQEVLRGVRAQ